MTLEAKASILEPTPFMLLHWWRSRLYLQNKKKKFVREQSVNVLEQKGGRATYKREETLKPRIRWGQGRTDHPRTFNIFHAYVVYVAVM